MKIEIHVLQNFASSNLNRDDTGTPKDCELGGVRRARVSSQCLKRAMREAFEAHSLVPADSRAARTKRLVERVATIVSEKKNIAQEIAQKAVAAALAGASIKADPEKEWKTQYLLFVPSRLVGELAALVVTHLDALIPATEAPVPELKSAEAESAAKKSSKKNARQAKADAKGAIPDEVVKAVDALLADGARTPELALFGRMIADEPKWNVDASCQVAHAVSTNRVSMEFDFYTAIDDLKKDDTAGSDMMGTISFNSACFYRYLVVDIDALGKNLGGDDPARMQARETTAALMRAAVLAIPSGKQNSMAAHNLPSFVLVDVRDKAESRSLTNAFVDPVRPRAGLGGDLVSQSIDRLAKHFVALEKVYGSKGRNESSRGPKDAKAPFFIVVGESDEISAAFAKQTGATDVGSLDHLVNASVSAAFGDAA